MRMFEFIGKVQNHASLPSMEQAIRATRATLVTLGERVGPDTAQHLRVHLPEEIGQYLEATTGPAEEFSSGEFLKRISERSGVAPPDSTFQARAVLDALQETVSSAEMWELLRRLPEDYARLFTPLPAPRAAPPPPRARR
jgi:uncharacterized protein (DUF2267 family)